MCDFLYDAKNRDLIES